jgi:hypothetical protein
VDTEKVKAIMEWPVLKNDHEVKKFMGLSSYYRRFVEGFSKIAETHHHFVVQGGSGMNGQKNVTVHSSSLKGC